jgi:myosin heavy subunit
MKKIDLKRLSLRNFKGIKAFDLALDGDVSIYGTNATGKTTLFDALTWLLFDKDSLNSAQFEIKPIGKGGLETEVEGTFIYDKWKDPHDKLGIEMEKLVLKKVFKEKWVKKRGSAKKEFTGHTTTFFVNDVPTKMKDYKEEVASICEESLFLLLTNPRHFNSIMKWQDRREMLLAIAGDISNEDVIGSIPELSELTDIIGRNSIENYRKIVKAQMTKVNEQIEDIPVRISEVERSIPEETTRSEKTIKSCLAVAQENRKSLVEKVEQIKTGGEIAAKRKELAEIETKIIKADNAMETAKAKVDKANREEKERLERAIKEAKNALENETDVKDQMKTNYEITLRAIKEATAKCEKLREQWHEENDRIFDDDHKMEKPVCPTCNQPLPPEQVEAAREKALKSFNAAKAMALREINKKGASLKSEIKYLEKGKAINLKETDEITKLIDIKTDEYNKAVQALDDFEPELSDKNEYIETQQNLTIEKERIEKAISDLLAGAEGEAKQVQAEINKLEKSIDHIKTELVELENIKKAKKRIKDLGKQERQLAADYEKLEKHLHLIELFTKQKVKMLEDPVNSMFEVVDFKLFKELINGGIEPCCIATVDGVPYESVNNGARINAGLDIINVASQYHAIALPVFVDNAESIVDILPTTAQQIKLYVSEADETLRVEGGAS